MFQILPEAGKTLQHSLALSWQKQERLLIAMKEKLLGESFPFPFVPYSEGRVETVYNTKDGSSANTVEGLKEDDSV